MLTRPGAVEAQSSSGVRSLLGQGWEQRGLVIYQGDRHTGGQR